MPIIAWRAKPSCSGSVTATICITPLSISRCTRCRTAASESPTALPMAAYGMPAVLLQLLDDALGDVVEHAEVVVVAVGHGHDHPSVRHARNGKSHAAGFRCLTTMSRRNRLSRARVASDRIHRSVSPSNLGGHSAMRRSRPVRSAGVSRRGLLQGASLVRACARAAAACWPRAAPRAPRSTRASARSTDNSDQEKDIVFSNWIGYVDPVKAKDTSTLEKFEQETGITVDYRTATSTTTRRSSPRCRRSCSPASPPAATSSW